jgi:hypothetical protein
VSVDRLNRFAGCTTLLVCGRVVQLRPIGEDQ